MTIIYNTNSIIIKKTTTHNQYTITNDSEILSTFQLLGISYKISDDNLLIIFTADKVQVLSSILNIIVYFITMQDFLLDILCKKS